MREIKFRAWNKDKKIMYPTDKYFEPSEIDLSGGMSDDFDLWEHDSASDYHEKVILMQYTGLKDKNGKEIYEGDILRLHGKGTLGNVFPEGRIFEVKWIDGGFHLGKSPLWQTVYLAETCEIIGNIYENSELLEDSH